MPGRALQISARAAAALGFLSITLTGEISPFWITMVWVVWISSFLCDRAPAFEARIRRLETAAVAGLIALLFIDFFVFGSTIFIAVTHFLLFFQMIKLAGEKSQKDCLQIFVFSFFQILAACTLSVDAWHAAVLIVFIPIATSALFWNQMTRERQEAGGGEDVLLHRRYRRMAAWICALSIPLNVLLTLLVFVLFPRLTINASLPGFSNHRTGYTDQVNLAQTGSLRQDAAVVLWLAFPRPEDRRAWNGYLRGEVMSLFDGRKWSALKGGRQRILAPDSNGIFFIRPHGPSDPLVHSSITLADTSAATLFTTISPVRVLAPLPVLQENEEGTLHWLALWNRPLRYSVMGEPATNPVFRAMHLDLPPVPLDRIRKLTLKAAGDGPPLTRAQNIEGYLRSHYRYSIDYGLRLPDNPVDYFLFEHRQGTCGHFASAMALMLRLQNIPSRLVAGYYKGEWNEPGQCIVIRERDAHAWVEAFIPGKGWVDFDPTPTPAAALVPESNWLHKAEQYGVYFSYQWNRLVIQYDLYAQIRTFETLKGAMPRFQFRFPHFRHSMKSTTGAGTEAPAQVPWIKMTTFLSLSLASIFLIARRRGPHAAVPVRFYSQFLERMVRAGHPKAPYETGWEFAQRLQQIPSLKDQAIDITQRYYQLRFARIRP